MLYPKYRCVRTLGVATLLLGASSLIDVTKCSYPGRPRLVPYSDVYHCKCLDPEIVARKERLYDDSDVCRAFPSLQPVWWGFNPGPRWSLIW